MVEAMKAMEIIRSKLVQWIEGLVVMLPNFVLALLIVVGFWLTARLVRKGMDKLLGRFFQSESLQRLISTLLYATIMLVGMFTALSVLHLDRTVTSLLAGAGIIGLALGFAFQDIAANFIAGILMASQHPIRVGDLIETAGEMGVVQRIDLRTTELRNLQGVQVIVPNKDIFQNKLINYTRNGVRRVDLELGVSFAEDFSHVAAVSMDAVKAVPDVLVERGVDVFYQGVLESRVAFEVRFWITSDSNRHFHTVRSRVIVALKEAYRREGITIPFPIRTLDLGIKGGERLDAMLKGQP